jgi:predicted ABC-type exoprotein transport system permease subunit
MLDDELAALWRKDVQRERDPVFELTIMRRMEQVIFRRTLALTLVAITVVTVLFAFCAPLLAVMWQQTFGHFINAPMTACFLMVLSYALSKLYLKRGV